MKKISTLLAMMVMLAFSSQAAYYLVGNAPFGNGWDPSTGVELTLNSSGTYSFKATINGSVWFVFADGLADAGDWTTFNDNLRIGPTAGDETVVVDTWTQTQKSGGDHGAYKFTGSGSEYTITYNPYINKFKIEGAVEIKDPETFTVAGTPANLFGTEWDQTNTANDMVNVGGKKYELYKSGIELAAGEIAFKIVGDHDWGNAWPSDNYVVAIEQDGVYDLTFTFDYDTKEVGCAVTAAGEPYLPEELFILGEVNGNGWDPSNGVKMESIDENVFFAEVTTDGKNIDENDGIGYNYFSFTGKLSESSDDWSSINAYRIGSTEDGYLLSEDMFGVEIGMGGFGTSNSFRVAEGTYDITVNVAAKTLVINKVEPTQGYNLEKVWEITDVSFLTTNDSRQGFGMNGKFYVNDKAAQLVRVIDQNGLTETTYPGGMNCGITRDEAGNLVISNAEFPGAWTEATIKVINPETGDVKEYTVPEECGLQGRCDFIGFAKGNLMENGAMYLTGGNTGTDPFTNGVAILTIADGEVSVDDCYLATCDGISGQTSTVINYYTDLNDEDALVYAYRSGNPSKLTFDGENLEAQAIVLPGKGHANGIFPFLWDNKELFIYPTMPDYQNGFAIAEAGADEPVAEVATSVAANANVFQADWLNAEVDGNVVTIYQYYPGGNFAVYRMTKEGGNVEELINDNTNKVVAGVRYFNIMGQEMKEANGITIVVTTYTDGSHSAIKVIK